MTAKSSTDQPLVELDGQLPLGEVHVWLANLELEEGLIRKLGSLLNPEEQQRAAQFEVAPAKKQFVASRAFLRIVLGKYLGINAREVEFRWTSRGKPELAGNPSIHFNLSHTQGLAAIAVTRVGAVGLDVERIRDQSDVLQLADRFFSKKEADWVRSQVDRERAAGFFSCWTAKEAYVKARGGGLSIPLNEFAIVPDLNKLELQLEAFGDAAETKRWSMRRLDLPAEFRGAVALEGAIRRVRMGRLSATEL